MSRPQDPHWPFFPFGNPFRMISPKGSQLSARLLSLLNTFEQTLVERLKKLQPKSKEDVLSLTWMKAAMLSLCETHTDIKTLITELELPVTDWDEKWIDMYFDISVKLLDICIAFSSELTRLNQSNIFVQCAMHNLESNNPNQFVRACSSLDSWRQHMNTKNQRVENCHSILNTLVESLELPKLKNSAKGQVLMRAMYGVKVQTVFVCSVFAAAFSGASKKLLDLNVSDTLVWAQAYCDIQGNVNGAIREILSCGKFPVLKELDAVDSVVKKLYPMIQEGMGATGEKAFKNSFTELRTRVDQLSQGIDHLAKEVDSFFKIVLTGRDALLCNLRTSDPFTSLTLGANVQQEVVR